SNPFELHKTTDKSALRSRHSALNGQHSALSTQRLYRKRPLGERLRSAVRGFAIEAVGHLRQTPPRTMVHIASATDYNADLAGILRRQYEAFRERVPLAGKRVVL